jgi:hypothetical protein
MILGCSYFLREVAALWESVSFSRGMLRKAVLDGKERDEV